MWYLKQIHTFDFFFIKNLKNLTPSTFWGHLGADLLERPKPPNSVMQEISRVSGGWGKYSPYSFLARNRCMWLYILSHSQPALHFYIWFVSSPNAAFRPGTSGRRPCSLCMDVCRNKTGQRNQHTRLVFICLSRGENMSCVWKCSDIVKTEKNWGGLGLFDKRNGRTAVVKAGGIPSLRFYYAVWLYWPPKIW